MLFTMGGCISDNGTYPTPSANFTPKQTYAIPHDKLWQTILDTLDKNRITTVNIDKSSDIIQTDYIAAPGTLIALGFGGAQNIRYKYNISLRSEADGSEKMNIICKIESSMYNGQGSSQWRDVTPSDTALATKLETWLYEQIEDGLKTP